MGWLRENLKKIKPLRASYRWVVLYPKRRQEVYFNKSLMEVVEFDKLNGTNFSGRLYQDEIGTVKERANDYSPSPDLLTKALDKLNISSNDRAADLGCGKGYAIYQMSKYAFGFLGGVELSTLLFGIAEENLKKMLPQTDRWKIYNSDVGLWDKYEEFNYFYMYNPFPEKVVREVKKKIDESIRKNPRKVTLLYLMPQFPYVFLEDSEHWKLVSRSSIFEQNRGMHVITSV